MQHATELKVKVWAADSCYGGKRKLLLIGWDSSCQGDQNADENMRREMRFQDENENGKC